MSYYNLFSQHMSAFCRFSTRFIIFIPRLVTTSFLRFFAVPVRGFCILKPSGTGPVRGPSKKGNRTETGPDFKALMLCDSQARMTWRMMQDCTLLVTNNYVVRVRMFLVVLFAHSLEVQSYDDGIWGEQSIKSEGANFLTITCIRICPKMNQQSSRQRRSVPRWRTELRREILKQRWEDWFLLLLPSLWHTSAPRNCLKLN